MSLQQIMIIEIDTDFQPTPSPHTHIGLVNLFQFFVSFLVYALIDSPTIAEEIACVKTGPIFGIHTIRTGVVTTFSYEKNLRSARRIRTEDLFQ